MSARPNKPVFTSIAVIGKSCRNLFQIHDNQILPIADDKADYHIVSGENAENEKMVEDPFMQKIVYNACDVNQHLRRISRANKTAC